MRNSVYAVILVGGKGKRLRPLSTDARPKAFLSVAKDRRSMFRMALDRIKKIIPSDNIVVVANKAHAGLVRKDFPGIKKENLLLEPVSRNTAPAISFAASRLQARPGDAVMVILPADQYTQDENEYLASITAGIEFAEKKDALVVLGVQPTAPSTKLGYVKLKGREGGSPAAPLYKVARFTEKPGPKTAEKFIADGAYLWNAGAFVFRAGVLLEAVKKFAPKIFDNLKRLKEDTAAYYRKMPDISIDYAVMEKAKNIYCVKGSYRWKDMGSFESLKEILRLESRDFAEKDGKIVGIL